MTCAVLVAGTVGHGVNVAGGTKPAGISANRGMNTRATGVAASVGGWLGVLVWPARPLVLSLPTNSRNRARKEMITTMKPVTLFWMVINHSPGLHWPRHLPEPPIMPRRLLLFPQMIKHFP